MLSHHDLSKNFIDLSVLIGNVDTILADPNSHAQMLLNCHKIEKDIMLLAQTEALPHDVSVFSDRVAMDDSIATRAAEHTSQHVDRSGLASTVMAEQRDDFILFYAEGQFVNSTELSKLLGHLAQLDRIRLVKLSASFALPLSDRALLAHFTLLILRV